MAIKWNNKLRPVERAREYGEFKKGVKDENPYESEESIKQMHDSAKNPSKSFDEAKAAGKAIRESAAKSKLEK